MAVVEVKSTANGLPPESAAGGSTTVLARVSDSLREPDSPYWRVALSRMSERTANGSDASVMSAGGLWGGI